MPIVDTGSRRQSESPTNKKVRDWIQNFNKFKNDGRADWMKGVLNCWSWRVRFLFVDRDRGEKIRFYTPLGTVFDGHDHLGASRAFRETRIERIDMRRGSSAVSERVHRHESISPPENLS